MTREKTAYPHIIAATNHNPPGRVGSHNVR
jgi:hypothetical protein